MMRGRVILTDAQSNSLSQKEFICLEREQYMEVLRSDPAVGDFIWCQEPFTEYREIIVKRYQGIKAEGEETDLCEIVAGPRSPLDQPKASHGRAMRAIRRNDAKYLPRSKSRATLEVVAISVRRRAIACKIHMKNVDELLR